MWGWGAPVPAPFIPFPFPCAGGAMRGWVLGGVTPAGLEAGTGGPGLVLLLSHLLPTGGCPHCATGLQEVSAHPGLSVLAGGIWDGVPSEWVGVQALRSWAPAHPPHRPAPPGDTKDVTSEQTGAAIPGLRRWSAHLLLGQAGGSECCPGSCQRVLEVGRGCGSIRGSPRSLASPWTGRNAQGFCPEDPLSPAPSCCRLSCGASASCTFIARIWMWCCGAMSGTGGGRQGWLCPAALSGRGQHKSMARLACGQPAGTAPRPSVGTARAG